MVQGTLPTIRQAISSYEIDPSVIFYNHQRRRKICLKEIVTPHETRLLRSLTKTQPFFFKKKFPFLSFVILLSLMILFLCIYELVCNSLQTDLKGEGKNRKKDQAELVRREKKKRKRR